MYGQVVTGEAGRGKRVMVFCNTLDSARATEHFLRERGLPTLSYHGDVPLDGRRQAIAQFAAEEAGPSGQPVLVCTDLAARWARVICAHVSLAIGPLLHTHRAMH